MKGGSGSSRSGLLSSIAVAQHFQRSVRTVRFWAVQGFIPGARKVGRDWLFDARLALAWTPPTPRGRNGGRKDDANQDCGPGAA